MSPARLRECLDTLGWSARHLAALTCRDVRTVRRWLAGRVPVPWQIAEWLESRARHAEQTPPPTDARHKSGAWTAETAQTP